MADSAVDPLAFAGGHGAPAGAGLRAGVSDGLAELVDLAGEPTLQVALRAVREMLDMDVAYVSEIVGEDMIFRELEGDGTSFGLGRGGSLAREQTYCQRCSTAASRT